ncbi:hypothetical protein HYS47_03255 [Candidatus Woesearchaeota archaeon]|nr:hypothetical protein [Candidatus Woesearchaeota archaeon]
MVPVWREQHCVDSAILKLVFSLVVAHLHWNTNMSNNSPILMVPSWRSGYGDRSRNATLLLGETTSGLRERS